MGEVKNFRNRSGSSFWPTSINANLTYYNRLTSDKYANITIPSTSGVSSFTSNNGKFQNQGFEFELAFKVIDSKDWKWNLNWNGALNKNKVVALPDNGLERNRSKCISSIYRTPAGGRKL